MAWRVGGRRSTQRPGGLVVGPSWGSECFKLSYDAALDSKGGAALYERIIEIPILGLDRDEALFRVRS